MYNSKTRIIVYKLIKKQVCEVEVMPFGVKVEHNICRSPTDRKEVIPRIHTNESTKRFVEIRVRTSIACLAGKRTRDLSWTEG